MSLVRVLLAVLAALSSKFATALNTRAKPADPNPPTHEPPNEDNDLFTVIDR